MRPLAGSLLWGEVRCGESGSMSILTPTQETKHSHHPREFTSQLGHTLPPSWPLATTVLIFATNGLALPFLEFHINVIQYMLLNLAFFIQHRALSRLVLVVA